MPIMPINIGMTDDERKRRAVEEAMRASSMPRLPDTTTPNRPILPAPRRPNLPNRMPGMGVEPPPPSPDMLYNAPPIPVPNVRNGIASPETAPSPSPRLPEFQPAIARGDEYRGALDEFTAKPMGRGKSILLGLGLGALRGLATGEGLGAGLGGAIAGGLTGAVSPKSVRRQQFEMFRKPQILENWQMEDADAARARQQQQDLMNRRLGEAQLDLMGSQAAQNRAQAQRALLPPAPGRQQRAQLKLGVNKDTGQRDWYDPLDPEQSKLFTPYVRETPARQQRQASIPSSARTDLRRVDEMKRQAIRAWEAAGKKAAGSAERQKAEAAASQAQAAYNAEVARFGELYGDQFETGGFEGPNAWGYVKKRPGQGGRLATQPRRGSKATVDEGFINFVMSEMGISDPNEARRMIEDDGYRFNQR